MTDYTKLIDNCRKLATWIQPEKKSMFNDWEIATETVLFDAAAAIEELQAQLPKRGKWELIDVAEPMRWGCSRCKYLSWETSNYCPRCGAKMEVQE